MQKNSSSKVSDRFMCCPIEGRHGTEKARNTREQPEDYQRSGSGEYEKYDVLMHENYRARGR